jgi:hypothetical protein
MHTLDNFPDDGQTDTRALEAGAEGMEHPEDAFLVVRGNANAVVLNADSGEARGEGSADCNLGPRARSDKFDSVSEEI